MNKGYQFITSRNYLSVSVDQLDELELLAGQRDDGVYRYNLHKSFDDKLQEMIICLSVKVNPAKHRHKDKSEVISIIRGKCLIEFFNNDGVLEDRVVLDKQEISFCRINENTWHRVSPIGSSCIIHEVSTGPFKPEMMEVFND